MSGASDFNKILDLADKEFELYHKLPFAVCLLSKAGTFLRYNEECRILFDLPAQPSQQDNINSFYVHPNDRKENLARLKQLEKNEWLKDTTIDLKVNGVVKYVRDYTKAIWDEGSHNITGLLCLMVNITQGGRYDQLFNDLPIGIFSFRQDEGLINANTRFLEMHGYDSFDEVYQKEEEAFITSLIDLAELRWELKEHGGTFKDNLEHRKKDGTVFTAALNAIAVKNSEGQAIGMEGFIEDISTETIYSKLVSEVPIGLYKVRINADGEHIIVHCNRHFANHRGAKNPEELIGKDIRTFHKSEEHFSHFHNKLVKQDESGGYLLDYILEAFNGRNELRKYEVHGKILRDENNRIIGRVGAERDVTDYLDTKEQLSELTTDFGKVLHSYSSTLIHSKHSMEAVIRSIISDELKDANGQLSEETILTKITQEIKSLDHIVERLLEKNTVIQFFNESKANELSRMLGLLTGPTEERIKIQKLALIRDGAIEIKEMTADFSKGRFPKELIKELKRQLEEILRLCSLITLSRGVEAILEMETVVNNLRSYILTRVKQKEKLQRLDIYDIIIGAVRNMEEYAANRNIDIKMNLRDIKGVFIDGYENDLVRTILNILHNAVKYSWVRKGPSKAFVSVEGRTDADWLYIIVENWGVAITRKELDEGLIFKVGYRGINSSDRRRPGTGLGLYDSLKVIEKHDGQLKISSKPSLGNAPDDYTSPFITKVIIQLPRNNRLS